MYMYTQVNLFKAYENLQGMTNRIKLMLSGMSIMNTGYFNNIKIIDDY